MPTWPNSLPDSPLQKGYQESRQSGVVRSQMDTGPSKTRRRFTATVTTFRMRFKLTTSQVDTLESFFEIDLDHGALKFDWTHPRTGSSVQFRFVEPYQITSKIAKDLYEIQAKLEILP